MVMNKMKARKNAITPNPSTKATVHCVLIFIEKWH